MTMKYPSPSPKLLHSGIKNRKLFKKVFHSGKKICSENPDLFLYESNKTSLPIIYYMNNKFWIL